ncbi:Protein Wnt-5a [Trichinella pseudospiralis]|uniref:Protein Wnt n=1 Tax=Trichinella pseudospiralis TaxID=6337 RepID=A0A0V0XSN0_TRIPS|nr:Protein Wnt-5a [Trichinella pseudospiralis]
MFGHTAGMLRWSFLLTIVVILLYSRSTDSIRWLALGQSNKLWNHAQHCPRTRFERKRYGLAGVQTRLCKRHADLMPIIMKSASQSVMICQQQFKNYRWNCSSVRQVPKLPPDLTKGTREQALVYALSAAAVAHGIAKACSSGTIAYCPCGNAVSGAKFDDYIRKGCSDNVPYGQKVSKEWTKIKKFKAAMRLQQQQQQQQQQKQHYKQQFQRSRYRNRQRVQSQRSYHDDIIYMRENTNVYPYLHKKHKRIFLAPRARMNHHNYRVGRNVEDVSFYFLFLLVLTDRWFLHFLDHKSHVGIEMQMSRCIWIVQFEDMLESFTAIDASWRNKKYSRAAEVRWLSGGNSARYSVEPYALVGRVTEDDLVYIRKSPDYCTEDPRVGSIGTQGRTCNATEQSSAGCDSMCCGRGHEIVFEYVISNCRCRYVHCCYVECDRCRELAEKHPPSELALHSTRRSVRCCRSETTVGLCLFACSPGATATDGSERKNGDEPVAVVYSVRLATTFQRSPLLLPLEGLTPLVLLFSSSATAPVAATLLSRFNSERAEPKHEDGLLFESLK